MELQPEQLNLQFQGPPRHGVLGSKEGHYLGYDFTHFPEVLRRDWGLAGAEMKVEAGRTIKRLLK